MTTDEKWMRKALDLAARGEGATRPNPPVGAVVVRRDKAVGSGYHRKAGGAHAEASALKSAGNRANGATLYVSLEPCSTYGRTPPCVENIISSGITRVVISTRDPNPKHSGRGIRLLKKSRIKVTENILKDDGNRIIAPFRKWITSGKPYLDLKLGVSLDGRIADLKGTSRWITGVQSRQMVQDIRSRTDAILVGRETAQADNPSLISKSGRAANAYRIVVDSAGRLSSELKIFTDSFAERTIFATTEKCPIRKQKTIAARGAKVLVLQKCGEHVSLKQLLRKLGGMGLLRILCEGGAELANGLIRAGLVDEYLFFISPRIIGGYNSVPAITGQGWPLATAPKLKFTEQKRVGEDIFIRAVPLGKKQ